MYIPVIHADSDLLFFIELSEEHKYNTAVDVQNLVFPSKS